MQANLTPNDFPIPVNASCLSDLPGTEGSPIYVPLSSIDAPTLSALCDAYRKAVFAAAGKVDPKVTV